MRVPPGARLVVPGAHLKVCCYARNACCAVVLTHRVAAIAAPPCSTATNPFETPALRRQQEEESGAAAFAATAAAPALAAAAAPGASAGGGAGNGASAAAAKAAQKQELLRAVWEEEYEAEELDPEWGHLLGDLDSRLQVGWAERRQRLPRGGVAGAGGASPGRSQLAGYLGTPAGVSRGN